MSNSGTSDLKTAIKSAKKAHYEWANQSNEFRRDLLFDIANEIEKDKEKFAIAETIDNGKPIIDSMSIDIQGQLII